MPSPESHGGEGGPPQPQRPKQPKQEANGDSSDTDSPFWNRDEPLWKVDSLGDCQVQGPCLSSPNFPQFYGDDQTCTASLPPFSVIRVMDFSTEEGYDYLIINGRQYSGSGLDLKGASIVARTNISWSSDSSNTRTGWRICVEKPPSCSDGLQLIPVTVSECPSATDPLPNCFSAEKGQLCEGDGTCGTREDINNCFDGYSTLRRDIYRKWQRKGSGAASGTTTPQELKQEELQVDGPFWHVGDCQVQGPCLSSPNFPQFYGDDQTCTASLPPFSVIRVMDFSTEEGYDYLTINGRKYSGGGFGLEGTSIVLWSNISWSSDGSNERTGWRICVEKPPSCSDGLQLTPVTVSECPSATDPLPNCFSAEKEQLCEGDGTCGTREDINNCYGGFHTYRPTRDVYRKGTGTTVTETSTTRTATTRTTTTLSTVTTLTRTWTSTTSTTTPLMFRTIHGGGNVWTVGGPCQVKGKCWESPNYPSSYGPNESCVASLPAFSVIRIDDFVTEKYFDFLTVNGYTYSGFGLNGTSTSLWSNISWSSDGSNGKTAKYGELRWRICLEKPPSCSDGLDLTPVSIADCPAEDTLPDCHSAEPGQLCEGDGTCGTREDINNCYDRFQTYPPSSDVYRKGNGTTRTSTTSKTATTTSTTASTTTLSGTSTSATTVTGTTSTESWKTDGIWHYSGQCVVKDNCAQFDESGDDYFNQQCALSFPTATFVEATLTKLV